MNSIKILLIACLVCGFYSCKEDPKTATPENKTSVKSDPKKEPYKAVQTTATFNDSLVSSAYNQYIVLKTALVNTNQEKSALAADVLMTHFANLGVSEEALIIIQNIKESKTIDGQRKSFTDLTPVMEDLLKDAIASGTVYKQFCPMANNNTGAYWLSNSKEVYNPYFGDVMLHCGRVTEELTQ